MKKPTRQLINRMRKKAKTSPCRFKIVAFGFNHKGECVAQETNAFRFTSKGGGLHAEMVVMKYAQRKNIKSIFILRVGRAGDILPIDPCSTCQEKADELGIKITTVGV